MNKDKIIEELEELPDKIKTIENSIYNYFKQVELNEIGLVEIDNLFLSQVSAETDSEGKKKYTNDISRRAEQNVRLSRDQQYREIKSNLEHNKSEMKKQEREYNYLKNRFTALKYIIKLLTMSS